MLLGLRKGPSRKKWFWYRLQMRLLWFCYRVVFETSGRTSVPNSKLSTPPGSYLRQTYVILPCNSTHRGVKGANRDTYKLLRSTVFPINTFRYLSVFHMKLDSLNSCSSKNLLILKTFSIKKKTIFPTLQKCGVKWDLRGKMGHLYRHVNARRS